MGRLYRVRPADAPLRPWPRLDRQDGPGLVAALDSPSGWQRDMATQLLLWRNDKGVKSLLEKLATDCPHDLARLHALITLDGLSLLDESTVLAVLRDRSPVVRRHAVRCAEPFLTSSHRVAEAVLALGADPDVRVRIQTAILLSGWTDPRAATALGEMIAAYRADPYFLAAAVSGLNKDTARPVYEAATRAAASQLPGPVVRDLAATLVAVEPAETLKDVVRLFATPGPDGFTPDQLLAVAATFDALDRRPGGWAAAGGATTLATFDRILDQARKNVDAEGSSPALVLASIPLLGRTPAARNLDLRRLAGLLAADRPPAVQTAALTSLTRSADDAVPPLLVAAWAKATPALRLRILDALAARAGGVQVLLDALEKGLIPRGEMDPARRYRLLTDDRREVRAHAEKVFSAANSNRTAVIDSYQSVMKQAGDRARGKAVFAKTCSACHRLDGVGSAVGPDLAALADKTPRYLLGEILDPNRNVDSRFLEYRAVLKDGRTVTGVLESETATGVTLRGQQGKDETVRRVDIDQLRSTGKSLMPEGLEADISPAAMADLLAYLTTATPPVKSVPGNTPAEVAAVNGTLTLSATKAAIHGGEITLEPGFQNIGYWHGVNDHVSWAVRLDKAATFDVYLDYACAPESAGNAFALDGATPTVEGKVASTGGWDKYQAVKVGTVTLPAGTGKVTVRPTGLIRGALFDLRTVYLVPEGSRPK
jgi:putative heme-binding domain-containing protein